MQRTTTYGRARGTGRRGLVAVALAVVALLGVACTPSPGGAPTPEQLLRGGTYPIAATVTPQTFTNPFPLFGMPASCSTTATTPSLALVGATLTLGPTSVDPVRSRATLNGVAVRLPRTSLSAGTLRLTCFGTVVGTIGFNLEFNATVSVQSATLDLTTRTVTVAQPRLRVTDARLALAGGASGLRPIPLNPFDLSLPSVVVPLGGGARSART